MDIGSQGEGVSSDFAVHHRFESVRYTYVLNHSAAPVHCSLSLHIPLLQELGRRWAALSSEDKAPYERLGREDSERYQREKRALQQAARHT